MVGGGIALREEGEEGGGIPLVGYVLGDRVALCYVGGTLEERDHWEGGDVVL